MATNLFNPPPIAYDPYEDLLASPGKELFAELVEDEGYFIVPHAHYLDVAKMNSRQIAVHIIKTNYPKKVPFDPQIPYMAITYYDRYTFANHDLQLPDIELIALCCLALSWKLHDHNFSLAGFMGEKKLSYAPEKVFEIELAICRTLEWRMRTLTPYRFVGFLTPFLCFNLPEDQFYNLILATQREVGFGGKRPSVIAAAASLVAANRVSANHVYLLMRIIQKTQPLIPFLNEIVECTSQMGLMFIPPVDDTSLPSPPHGQTSSGTEAPAGTAEPAPGQRCEHAHDVVLREIIVEHIVSSSKAPSTFITESTIADTASRLQRPVVEDVAFSVKMSHPTLRRARSESSVRELMVAQTQGEPDSCIRDAYIEMKIHNLLDGIFRALCLLLTITCLGIGIFEVCNRGSELKTATPVLMRKYLPVLGFIFTIIAFFVMCVRFLRGSMVEEASIIWIRWSTEVGFGATVSALLSTFKDTNSFRAVYPTFYSLFPMMNAISGRDVFSVSDLIFGILNGAALLLSQKEKSSWAVFLVIFFSSGVKDFYKKFGGDYISSKTLKKLIRIIAHKQGQLLRTGAHHDCVFSRIVNRYFMEEVVGVRREIPLAVIPPYGHRQKRLDRKSTM